MLFENNGNKISLNGANGMLTWRQPVVFLARHGTPDWNMTSIRYDIPPGPPLVPQGEEEAAKLGKFLKSQNVQLVYASPLVRARRTARDCGRDRRRAGRGDRRRGGIPARRE